MEIARKNRKEYSESRKGENEVELVTSWISSEFEILVLKM